MNANRQNHLPGLFPRGVPIFLLILSHCDIEGNEKVDDLANKGRTKDQNNVPVTQPIVKAKIKAEKWEPTHKRAREVFKDRLKPKV